MSLNWNNWFLRSSDSMDHKKEAIKEKSGMERVKTIQELHDLATELNSMVKQTLKLSGFLTNENFDIPNVLRFDGRFSDLIYWVEGLEEKFKNVHKEFKDKRIAMIVEAQLRSNWKSVPNEDIILIYNLLESL